jgi:hypothetical protein
MKKKQMWRNGELLVKWQNRSTRVKNWERTMFIKPFYFQTHTSKMKSKQRSFYRAFACWQEPSFPFCKKPSFSICMDILKYVLAQATDWCAGFVVRVWWRYLRVRFNRHSKMAGKVLNIAKRRESHSITFCSMFYLSLPYRSLAPYNWSEYSDL